MRRLLLALSLCLLTGAATPPTVFDRAWSLIENRYWDPDLHGVDWAAAGERLRPAEPVSEAVLYARINALLALLGDSHAYAVPPSARRREDWPDEPAQPRAERLAGDVLLLVLPGFDPGAERWLAGEIAAARPAAVILDLRENGGGDDGTLDRVAGLFVAGRQPLLRLFRRRETVERTRPAREPFLGPLAVLVGPGTASAAEAFAAMIDESGRGLTVGARTAGRLTGAVLHRLPDGGQIAVPEYDVRTAGGRRLEGVGLAPQVVAGADAVEVARRRLLLQAASFAATRATLAPR